MKKIFSTLTLWFLLSISISSSFAEFSLTASGGVSLGVYEAGFLYYSMKSNVSEIKEREMIITGASAGAINSFVTILEKCSQMYNDPQQSLFWKTWIPLNFDNFFLKENQKAKSLLQRESLENLFSMLERRWNAGLSKGCSSTLGVTITRKHPLVFHEGTALNYSRVAENVVVKITGRGFGKEPRIENLYLHNNGIQLFLPLNQTKRSNYSLLKDLLLASSSFPLAFEPKKLPYCIILPSSKKECSEENIREDYFVDGGVYNNAPLDLAYKIAKERKLEKEISFVYLDPSLKEYPVVVEDEFESSEPSLFKDFISFFKDFVSSSRSGQISNFLSTHPEIGERLIPLKGSLPLASEPLYGFSGFFEEDFRVFDFYLGIVDAKIALKEKFKPLSKEEFEKLSYDWKWVFCMEAAFNKNIENAKYCSEDKSDLGSNLRVLFLVSIERLFSNCSDLSSYNGNHHFCKAAIGGKGPEVVFGKWDKDWKRQKNETHLKYILRRLNHYNFHFRDLGLKKSNGEVAIVKIKEKINKAIKIAAKSQPSDHQFLITQFSSPLLNFMIYTPTPVENYIMIGSNSFDIGRSLVFSTNNRLASFVRYGYGLMGFGLDSIYRSETSTVGFMPYLGIYWEPTGLSTPMWQYRVGLRGGYQFSTENSFKAGHCHVESSASRHFPSCSAPIATAVVSSSFLESVKIELSYSVPFLDSFENRPDFFAFLFGWQF